MSETVLTPDATGEQIRAAFAGLNSEAHTVRLTPGAYGAAQGVYALQTPDGVMGDWYTIHLEAGAILDFGATDWMSMFVPGREDVRYRSLWCGDGTCIEGQGMIRNGGGRVVRGAGRLDVSGITISSPASIGVLAVGGEQKFASCLFTGIGVDPELGDPIWSVVGRVPIGTVLQGGGFEYDIHAVVEQAGLAERIVFAMEPDIVDNESWVQERTAMSYLCKHLGDHGDGLKAIYSQDAEDLEVSGCTFGAVSGQAVHAKAAARALIEDNRATDCNALYHASHGSPLRVVGNRVRVQPRTYGPRRAVGFGVAQDVVPEHTGNVWEYHQGPGVHAYRTWNNAPLPDLGGDAVFSDDGQPVPVDEGEPLPAEPIPPPSPPPPVDRTVYEIAAMSDLDDIPRDKPCLLHFAGTYSERLYLRDFADAEAEFHGAILEGVECREVTRDDKGERWEGNTKDLAAFTLHGRGKVKMSGELLIRDCLSRGFFFQGDESDLSALDLDWSDLTITVRDCAYSAFGFYAISDMRGGSIDAANCNPLGRRGWDSLNKGTRLMRASFKRIRSHRHNCANFWMDYFCGGFVIDELDVCDSETYGTVFEFSIGGLIKNLIIKGNKKAGLALRAMHGLVIERIDGEANEGALFRAEGGSPEARKDRLDGQIRVRHNQSLTILEGRAVAPGDGPHGLWRNDMSAPSYDKGPTEEGVPADFEPLPHDKRTYFEYFQETSDWRGVVEVLESAGYEEHPFEVPEIWKPYLLSDPLPGEPPIEPPPPPPPPPSEPPVDECECEKALALVLIEIGALRASLGRIRAKLGRIEAKMDRPLVPVD